MASGCSPSAARPQGPAPKPRWMPLPAAALCAGGQDRTAPAPGAACSTAWCSARWRPSSRCWRPVAGRSTRPSLSGSTSTIRQHVAAVGRRVNTLCKGEDGLRQQLALYHVLLTILLPHASLRQPLPQPVPTNGTGSAKQWRPCTPAMAAGLTDHVWTLREVLLFRVPPWPQPQTV